MWPTWAMIACVLVVASIALMLGIRYGRRSDARARLLMPLVIDGDEPVESGHRRPWRRDAHRTMGAALRKVHIGLIEGRRES